jgi:hypothetical protein
MGHQQSLRRDSMKKLAIFVALVLLGGMLAASDPLSSVNSAVNSLCVGLKNLLPIAAMMAIVLAGVIYAAGQMMGAETRARANVWATAALTGALIAIMMAVVGPAVLNIIYPNSAFTGTGC